MSNPDNGDDIIDSRDIIARIEELENEREALVVTRDAAAESVAEYEADPESDEVDADHAALLAAVTDAHEALAAWDADEGIELQHLREFAEEGESIASDWEHGESFIRDDYFERYAQELAEDCGMTPKEVAWPYTCIDWEQAARELQMDYSSAEFNGVTYWARS
jgi:hypothetical protein